MGRRLERRLTGGADLRQWLRSLSVDIDVTSTGKNPNSYEFAGMLSRLRYRHSKCVNQVKQEV